MNRYWLAGIALASLSCAGPERTLPYYRTADLTPEWLSASESRDTSMHRVAPFSLTDQRGTAVSAGVLSNRISLVAFFFTDCGSVCPVTQTNLSALLAQFPTEGRIQVLMHSVTPERDSTPVLAAYASAHHLADDRWRLLTGARSEIERLATSSYFVNLNDGSDYATNNLAHTESVLLIDGMGRIRGVYSGSLRLEMERIAADIVVLLKES